MADIEHVNIQDPQIHEPKGVLAANAGEVYVADGALSGAWTSTESLNNLQYGGIYSVETDAILIGTIGVTAKRLLGFSSDMASFGVLPQSASHQITIPTAGDYFIGLAVTFHTVAVGDSGRYEFHVRINDVESIIGVHREMSGANDAGSASCHGILSLAANDVISIWVESDDGGDTHDIAVQLIQLTATLMKAA